MEVMKKFISASLMCDNLLTLKQDVFELEQNNNDDLMLHLDIMDGHFVNNLTFGPDITNAIQSITLLPCDYHLMVETPSNFLPRMKFTENDYVTIHAEIDKQEIEESIKIIKERGAKFGLAINPETSFEFLEPYLRYLDMVLVMLVNPGFAGQNIVNSTLDKVKQLKHWLNEKQYQNILIAVDGGVSVKRANKLSKDGANIFVGGTSGLYKKDITLKKSLEILRKNIKI